MKAHFGSGGGERMDNFLNKPIVLNIFALLLSVFLFIQVSDSKLGETARNVISSNDDNVAENIPVELIYDTENYIVTGAPEKVNVRISGPKSLVVSAVTLRDFQAVIELNDPAIGEQKVEVKINNLSDKLTAEVTPAEVAINVQERITVEHNVTVKENKISLEEGYKIEEVTTSPDKVSIVGGKDQMSKISSVIAVLDSKDVISSDVKRDARVVAVDEAGKPLDVTITPAKVSVDIKVTPPSKTVPINTEVSGKLPDGLVLESISLSETKVNVYGKLSVLRDISEIKVPIDLSHVTETTEYQATLNVSKNAEFLSFSKITVKIKVSAIVSKTYSGVPVSPLNLDDGLLASYPNGGTVEVVVSGTETLLNQIQASDLVVTYDAKDLVVGTHQVPLVVKGPENSTCNISNAQMEVIVSKK